MTVKPGQLVPVAFHLRADTLGRVDGLAARMRVDEGLVAVEADINRDTVLRLAIIRGLDIMEKQYTRRRLTEEQVAAFDPLTLLEIASDIE